MQFLLTLSVASIVLGLARAQTSSTESPTNEAAPLKIPVKDYIATPSTWDTNPNLNSLWAYHPVSHTVQQPPQDMDELKTQRMVYRQPMSAQASLTRLAKTMSFGFNPYFNKGYFEPFEKRPRPVTLVGIRKNGVFPHVLLSQHAAKSGEIAELQSPYNYIGSIWLEDFIKD